jgi:hypothetical protein
MVHQTIQKITQKTTQNTRIIGFHGRKYSGKDTSCEIIINRNPTKCIKILSFAEPLKQAAMIIFNLTYEQVYDPKLKDVIDPRYGKSPRQLIQWLGTDVLRKQFDEDHWIKHMKNRIDTLLESNDAPDFILINDIRFDNEAELIRSYDNSIIVEIKRPELDHVPDHGSTSLETMNHESEKPIRQELIDVTINNNLTKIDLVARIILLEDVLYGR